MSIAFMQGISCHLSIPSFVIIDNFIMRISCMHKGEPKGAHMCFSVCPELFKESHLGLNILDVIPLLGNQDTTCAVWDLRNLSSPLARLVGHMGAIRSLRFSPDGRFLAMAEPADFVHIFDIKSGFREVRT